MAMMKRSLALLMAIVLLAGVVVPAYAEEGPDAVGTAAGEQVQPEADDTADEPDATPGQTDEQDPADDQMADGDQDDAGDVDGDTDADQDDGGVTGDGTEESQPGDGQDGSVPESQPGDELLQSDLAGQPGDGVAGESKLAQTDGWLRQNGTWSYLKDSKKLSGWQTVGGQRVYFLTGSKNEWAAQMGAGTLATGLVWLGGRNWYYFDCEDNGDAPTVRMVKNEFRKTGDNWSYFGSDGKRVRGWQTINGQRLYFLTGSKNEWATEGKEYALATGQLWLGGKNWYYFDSEDNGEDKAPTVKMVKNDFRKAGDIWSYYGSDGKRVRGWQTINGQRLYFLTGSKNEWATQGKEYALATGQLWLGGKNWYYFDSVDNGDGDAPTVKMVKNEFRKIGSSWSYYGSDGKRVRGWQTIGGQRLYFLTGSKNEWAAQGGEYALATGLVWLGGRNWYYFDCAENSDGKAPTVKMVKNEFRGQSYFGSDGKRARGWQTIGGKKFYFLTGSSSEWAAQKGEYTQATGWLWLGGKNWYYIDADSGMMTGWQTISGQRYYFNGSGVRATGLTNLSGKWYYFNDDGQLQTGSIKLGVKTYSTDSDGALSGFTGSQQTVSILNQIGWNLRAAYTWAAGLRYANRSYRAGSVDAYANYGFKNRYGNCYVMNACLYKLAQTLGYEVKFINGGVRQVYGNDLPHGWCEIYDGDGWYVFDSNFHNETGRNGYRISYGQSGTWRYVAYNEMH